MDHFTRFAKAPTMPNRRIIGLSVGEVGTGKTHFWLGAPGPIVVFSFDKGLEGVVEPFQEHKDIYVAEYDWAPTDDLTQDDAIGLRDKFLDDFTHAVQHARTVIIDKETDLWQLYRYAEFGGPSENPKNYDALNQRYRKMINLPKSADINFGCIEGLKNEWVSQIKASGREGARPSGARVRSGFVELDGLVHLNLQHRREKGEAGGAAFFIDVGKARGPGGFDIQEQTFEGLDFSDFAQLVFPGTTAKDWA